MKKYDRQDVANIKINTRITVGKTNFGDLSIDEQKKDRFYVNRLSDDAVRTS